MNPQILAALGLEESATPETVLAKITDLAAAANQAARVTELETALAAANEGRTAAEAERDGAVTSLTEFRGELTAAQNQRDTATSRITTLEASLAIAANDAVARAVQAGRLTPAEAEAKATEILAANDLAEALQALGKLPAKVKTESATGDLGSAKSRLVIAANDETAAQRNERAVLVANEYANTNPALSEGERKRIAWQRAQKKNPEIFNAPKKDSSGSAA